MVTNQTWAGALVLLALLACSNDKERPGAEADAGVAIQATVSATPAPPPSAPAGNALPSAVRETLETAEKIEILRLEGDRHAGDFHDQTILARSTLRASERDALLAAIDQALTTWDQSFARCFNPRHAVRATKGGKTVDLVICFECHRMMIDGQPEPALGVSPKAEKLFDAIFARSGLKKLEAGR